MRDEWPDAFRDAHDSEAESDGDAEAADLFNYVSDVVEISSRTVDGDASEKEKSMPHFAIHRQFFEYYKTLRTKLLRALLAQLEKNSKTSRTSLKVTGHSLGGALASLCAFDLAHLECIHKRNVEINVVTFGSPRVGDHSWSQAFNNHVSEPGLSKLKKYWRIVREGDPIPYFPKIASIDVRRGLTYKHCGTLVSLISVGGDVGGEHLVLLQPDFIERVFVAQFMHMKNHAISRYDDFFSEKYKGADACSTQGEATDDGVAISPYQVYGLVLMFVFDVLS
eukprot:g5774.t1